VEDQRLIDCRFRRKARAAKRDAAQLDSLGGDFKIAKLDRLTQGDLQLVRQLALRGNAIVHHSPLLLAFGPFEIPLTIRQEFERVL